MYAASASRPYQAETPHASAPARGCRCGWERLGRRCCSSMSSCADAAAVNSTEVDAAAVADAALRGSRCRRNCARPCATTSARAEAAAALAVERAGLMTASSAVRGRAWASTTATDEWHAASRRRRHGVSTAGPGARCVERSGWRWTVRAASYSRSSDGAGRTPRRCVKAAAAGRRLYRDPQSARLERSRPDPIAESDRNVNGLSTSRRIWRR